MKHSIVLLAALLTALSCSKPPPSGPVRLTLLPAENQSGDASLDWAASLGSSVLAYDLTGSPHYSTVLADRAQGGMAAHSYFTASRGSLSLRIALEDLVTHKTTGSIAMTGKTTDGIVPLLDAAAKALDAAARPFCSRDASALKSYAQALAEADAGARVRLLQTVTVQDPKFTAASMTLAGILVAAGDRVHGAEVATAGAQTAADPLDRSQLQYLASVARDDVSAQEKALTELVRLRPSSADELRRLAQLHTLQRNFPKAIQDFEAVLKLEPNDGITYNYLAYSHAYSHDLPAAIRSLEQYRKLASPNDNNPIDSLGEVHYLLGDFPKALQHFQQEGNFLKAAQAKLMSGDSAGADALFQQSLAGSNPAGREFRQAQWEFLTARRPAAVARLEKLAGATGDPGAQASAQLAVWRLQSGDRSAAQKLAAAAKAVAVSPGVRNLTILVEYIVSAQSGNSPYPFVDGVKFLLAGQAAAAVPALQKAYYQTAPSEDAEVRTLLAWAYRDAGKAAEAKALVSLWILPVGPSDSLFGPLVYEKFMELHKSL